MSTATFYDLIGYVASGLIVLSLVMSSVLRLRIINLIGAIVFSVYGVLIGSVPVIATNAAIVLINVYYLRRLLGDRSTAAYFEVVPIGRDEPLLHRFLEIHDEAIRSFQPTFAGLRDDHLAWFVLREAAPVGVVLGRFTSTPADVPAGTPTTTPADVAGPAPGASDVPAGTRPDEPHAPTGTSLGRTDVSAGTSRADDEAGTRVFHLDVDHVTAPHRDFSVGAVLFGAGSVLQQLPADLITTAPGTAAHQRYLERMGFERSGELLVRSNRQGAG